eukprot:gene20601-biopygen11612
MNSGKSTFANSTQAGSWEPLGEKRRVEPALPCTGRNGRGRVRDASISSNPIVWGASGARPRPFLPSGRSQAAHRPLTGRSQK